MRPRRPFPFGPLSLCGLLLGLVAACATPPPPTDDAIAVVAGAHGNAPAPAAVGAVAHAIDHAARIQATMTLVVDSGTPRILSQGKLGGSCRNDAACAQAVATSVARVGSALASARADTPENNLLGALDLAARGLADHAGHRVLAVIDSGLQTTAPLRLQDAGVLGADPREVADYLSHNRLLPSLAGDTVLFSGLGDTVAPQAALSPAQRANLAAIWEAVARRAGAADVRFVETPLTGPPAPGLPPVTPVPLGPTITFTGATVDLPDGAIPFERDSATLRDPEAARDTLASLADRINATHRPVLLTGTTANVGPLAGQRALGKARAEAIRDILVRRLGVPADLISTAGVGSDWQGYVADHDPTGQLLPGPAAQNRRVVVAQRP